MSVVGWLVWYLCIGISKLGGGITSILLFICIWSIISNIKHRKPSIVQECLAFLSSQFADYKTISISFFITSILCTLLTSSVIHQWVGIHNLEIKPEGTYCFYVQLVTDSKTYTLPASVTVEEYEIDDGERTRTKLLYYINSAQFSNGNFISFSQDYPVKIDEPARLQDQNGVEWTCVLLNEHAYSPNISETNNADWLDIMLLLLTIFSKGLIIYAIKRESLNPTK